MNPHINQDQPSPWVSRFAGLIPAGTVLDLACGGGRHSRGAGYAKDAEKYLEAVLAGWTVIRLTERQLELDFIERIAAWINTPRVGECTSSCDPLQ